MSGTSDQVTAELSASPEGPEPFCEATLSDRAVRVDSLRKLRVALDLRDLPREQVGTRTYAVNLARELASLPDLELTLLVQDAAQARGLRGRVVAAAAWADDADLIHKPAQVMDPAELRLLFESKAHLVITYQDLIAFRIPLAFGWDAAFETYRATSRLMLPAVQRVIAYSNSVRDEIATEFGIPHSEISVVLLAADIDEQPRFAPWRRSPRLPSRYFFSLASDYPHKNLPTLLEAYRQLRARWHEGEPPHLVLAGYFSGARTGIYPQLEHQSAPQGVHFLGPVRQDQLVNIYKRADALVFASLYEGFGLPPLEAMAMGTPVIAMPVSAMPEVCSSGALFADDLSPRALCTAMERVAADPELRKDLRSRGYACVREYSWGKTARATFEAYRTAHLHPSDRSMGLRHSLREAIIDWSTKNSRPRANTGNSAGVRESWRDLKNALRARLNLEISRLIPVSAGK